MKFSSEVIINRSQVQVWQYFDNPAIFLQQQPGFRKFEQLGGRPGQPGGVSRVTFEEQGREVSVLEIVTHRQEPSQISARHEGLETAGEIISRFEPVSDTQTRWVVECDLTYRNVVTRMLSRLTAGVLRRKATATMLQVRALVESSN